MELFRKDMNTRSERQQEFYAQAEVAYTVIDFIAAVSFLIGSILFFTDDTQYLGTWLFVVGSICFALKPTLRLWRELRLYRMGKLNKLAERAER